MIQTQYSCLELPGIATKAQLVDALEVFAKQILEMPEIEQDSPFENLRDDAKGLNKDEDVKLVTDELLKYVVIEAVTPERASVILEAQYDSDTDNYGLCEEITKFLFAQSGQPYFLVRSAAIDRDGAYSHQWVGYWKDGAVVVEKTESYFDRVFTSTAC